MSLERAFRACGLRCALLVSACALRPVRGRGRIGDSEGLTTTTHPPTPPRRDLVTAQQQDDDAVMFSSGVSSSSSAEGPTLYKGIGSSPSAASSSSSGGFLYGGSGMSMVGSSRRPGASGDEDHQSPFLRLCSCISWLTLATGAAAALANLLLLLSSSSAGFASSDEHSGGGGAAAAGGEGGASASPAELLLRCYGLAFGLLVVACEVDASYTLRTESSSSSSSSPSALAACAHAVIQQHFPFMESWVLRGLFLIFAGTLLRLPSASQQLQLQQQIGSLAASSGQASRAQGLMSLLFGLDGSSSVAEGGVPVVSFLQHAVGAALIGLGCLYAVMGFLCFRRIKLRQLSRIRRRKAMAQEMSTLQRQKHEIERLLADTEAKLQHL